jgi:predicted TIM-barrel fold metal-dependent hydrolase
MPDPTVVAAHIVDAHHHIWRVDQTPWLLGPMVPRIFGDYEAIRRDYLIDEFAKDASAHGVVASIHVQANVAANAAFEEAEWTGDSGKRAGLVQAVVGYADLVRPDIADQLDGLLTLTAVQGVRQQLHWHPRPERSFAAAPDLMLRPDWQRGLRALTARGLLFELQVYPHQFEHAITLVDAFADTRFVLLHAGMLDDRRPEAVEFWQRGMARLAERPNIYVKLSGLGTFLRRCRIDEWRPVVEATVDTFGPGRAMFGSNFPIEKLWTSYTDLLAVFRACIAGYSASEQAQILHDVATHVYRLSTPIHAPSPNSPGGSDDQP